MKRIAIFCDGTWNTPDKEENGFPCKTNVARLAEAVFPKSKDGTIQRMFYDLGVGTDGTLVDKVYDGATGTGISAKIRQAYRFLIEAYEPGDELFFFGFSRGAFTVRSLSGLIRNSGILDKKFVSKVSQAYGLYKSRKEIHHPTQSEAVLFRKTYAVEEVTPIKFIGVWDTVGALGNPLLLKGIVSDRNKFHDADLSSKVENAYHAVSIDEKRRNFLPALWIQQAHAVNQHLEQVWFPGVHSDVGGGYPTHDLSDSALLWMKEKAESCNLSFDKLETKAKPVGEIHESMTWYYGMMGTNIRPIGQKQKGPTNESIHPSALQRYKEVPSYRPKNLVDNLKEHPLM